ncbi:MAG: VWA domain-containing protein [Patescibacteria group bacterium]|nr:VWA domain-containing protein [Patescibacteria group bacterium]MDE2438925.1 VWA domain-containing protein [Patescibacteria group bacterium]
MDDIVVTRKAPSSGKTAFEELASKAEMNLEALYDRLTWLWYCFDVSGSMTYSMAQTSGTTSPVMSKLSKLAVMKRAALRFVKDRYTKYPDAKVGVIKFDERPEILSIGASQEQTMVAIDQKVTEGGSTDIYRAIECALNQCKKSKGAAPHHLVVVTDGIDSSIFDLMPDDDGKGEKSEARLCWHRRRSELLTVAKETNAVCDVIFIVALDERNEYKAEKDTLSRYVRATGGVIEIVDSVESLETKLLAVSGRKLLMAGKI